MPPLWPLHTQEYPDAVTMTLQAPRHAAAMTLQSQAVALPRSTGNAAASIERGFVMHERGTGDATSEVRPEWVHELEVGIAAELVFPFAIVPCCWGDRAEHHTIFVGNPVAGKSTLLNALLSPIVGVFKSPDLKSAIVLPN